MSVWRILIKVFLLLVIIIIIGYGCLWYASQKIYPVDYGISFNRQHAQSLGLDWKKVYLAMLNDLQPKYIRIAASWSEVEVEPNKYDFTDVDWQMKEASDRKIKVIIVLGQKAPRWPECHVPAWVNQLSSDEYRKKLFNYLKNVVEHYKDNRALDIWQVENEPFINFQFGECQRFDKAVVSEEIGYVHLLDLNHKIIVTDSGELSTWKEASQAGDLFGTTIYRIVRTPKGMYWGYDWLPAAFYRYKAGFWGVKMENFYVSELQAEPWFSDSDPNHTPITEQEKSMNVERLKKHFAYVEKIGVSRTYLWGVEWWYWMKDKQNDDRYWQIVKEKLSGDK